MDRKYIITRSFGLVAEPITLPIDELLSYLLVGAIPSNTRHDIGRNVYCELLRDSCRNVLCLQLSAAEITRYKPVIDRTVANIISMGVDHYLSEGTKITKTDDPVVPLTEKITITGTKYDQPSIDYLASLGYKFGR